MGFGVVLQVTTRDNISESTVPSVKKYCKATVHKVALTIKEGRKASLFFPCLILGLIALLLLPTAASGVCACG